MSHNPPRPEPVESQHASIAQAFEVFGRVFGPFIDQRMSGYFPDELDWAETAANRMGRHTEQQATDPLFQLLVLRRFWGPVFAASFGEDLRDLIGELIEVRNRWAHFDLPDDPQHLDRCLLGIERLVAPVDPHAVAGLRVVRARLRQTSTADDAGPVLVLDGGALAAQLSEAEAAFAGLQDRYARLREQLEASRRAAAVKQLRLSTTEQRLQELRDHSQQLESAIRAERDTRARIEWLFASLIAVALLVMVLVTG